MDLIKEALSMGFANAAIMDTKDLVFVPEYRQFCEDNLCGNYNLVPACPPTCGTVEEMHEKALKYEKALVLQTVLKDPVMDPVLFKQAKHAQNILTEQLAKWMQENGKEDVLIMSAGPYKNCSCMSAYSVDAQKMADAVGMVCWADDSGLTPIWLSSYNLLSLCASFISYKKTNTATLYLKLLYRYTVTVFLYSIFILMSN